MASQTTAKTHTMRALVELRKRIIDGDIPGGTRLFEVALAEDLQISRTPVREAMSRLAEEGLLERARSGGFLVRSFAYADVIDTIELRGVLEGTAARLAAERGVSDAKLKEIGAIVQKLDLCIGETPDDVDFTGYSELNSEFHEVLAALPGSATLERELDRAKRLPFASPSAFLPDKTQLSKFRRSLHVAQEQHREIVTAIHRREGARAEALAREHAQAARRNLEYIFSKDRSLVSSVPGLALVASDGPEDV
ncbi:GntR family transcriptional regulator [Maritimibacter alkaliphilus]|uniref:GntR family transcriptional regulator n=1 Tax=Maritimibacter alkaliphilus TaxID=404236 RepID=UPI001C95EBEE|nr:GntR family transcriptional regulator [Maritimibacter alkaliphilus]MBY6089637.1 GntR family transcriptional regulator [Maritimibacter alkaliphilus]